MVLSEIQLLYSLISIQAQMGLMPSLLQEKDRCENISGPLNFSKEFSKMHESVVN